ncbi:STRICTOSIDINE SYNTHASE-RELATED [Salix viminalis]|uniref:STRICTOSIDINE SYNTHASE-RELATED n=1 Tax=Salix viminalis TaxID=40686 RepID=A0A9Q0ZQ52_SALVM|nr:STRICTOSIDINE SYNTHASE-RELATED [Salix viminalis]
MIPCVSACSGFLLACLLAFTLQIFYFSPLSPDLLELPPASALPTNRHLQEVTKLGEGFLDGPEDVVFDRDGVLYTAVRDGWIKRMHKNGSWENWKKIDSDSLLGIATSREGGLIVCDAEKGLLKVSEDGVVVLATHINDGSKIRFADEVIESSDGSLYFSAASTKFGFHDWYLDVLEAKPHGQLLKYDPSSNETSILLDGLCFPNGVALSREEDYLVFCESWKFRCRKYWLKGTDKGKTEIFIDNLPGGPDNIYLAPDGSFWIALLQVAANGLEFVHTSKPSKHLIASFPKLVNLVNGAHRKATVVNVAADGKITRKFDDPDGKVMSFVTTAFEFEDHLYLGTLNNNFIGKLKLNPTNS